jgi:uncharacterized protein
MKWMNEPTYWDINGKTIAVKTSPKTDFWRKTHYGFIRDNGHFYYQEVLGDFVAEVKVTGEYRDLYDQAGLMVRLDENIWLKCGIEFVGGERQISAVVTRDVSDWSVMTMPKDAKAIFMRVSRKTSTIEVQYSFDGKKYNMLRLAYLTEEPKLQVGIMCASPDGSGCCITFEDFKVQ